VTWTAVRYDMVPCPNIVKPDEYTGAMPPVVSICNVIHTKRVEERRSKEFATMAEVKAFIEKAPDGCCEDWKVDGKPYKPK
jgi:hypothetical protein